MWLPWRRKPKQAAQTPTTGRRGESLLRQTLERMPDPLATPPNPNAAGFQAQSQGAATPPPAPGPLGQAGAQPSAPRLELGAPPMSLRERRAAQRGRLGRGGQRRDPRPNDEIEEEEDDGMFFLG